MYCQKHKTYHSDLAKCRFCSGKESMQGAYWNAGIPALERKEPRKKGSVINLSDQEEKKKYAEWAKEKDPEMLDFLSAMGSKFGSLLDVEVSFNRELAAKLWAKI